MDVAPPRTWAADLTGPLDASEVPALLSRGSWMQRAASPLPQQPLASQES
jgi:hypothetical protein